MNDDMESDESDLARSVTRLGDTAEQLSEVLQRVDENQKTLLRLRLDVATLRDKAEFDVIRLDTQNQIAKVRNKTAVLVIIILIAASVFGLVSYIKVRSNANAASAAVVNQVANNNKCQIDFNTKVLAVLKSRGQLESETQQNITTLLQKIAIPGSSFEQGQAYRRDYVAQSIVIQAKRDAMVFPKTTC